MTNQEIIKIAMAQSALDLNCHPEDFLQSEPVVVSYQLGPSAKKFYREPITGHLVSYGNNIVAAVKDEIRDILIEYVHKFEFYHCFEPPYMHWLDERLSARGHKVCFLAEYYLPDVTKLQPLACDYELRVLHPSDFIGLYKPEWSNALCKDRKELDVLGVGAYAGDRLVGLAGCSADCEQMWQIGVDVLPEYRRQGIAAALTSRLAVEVFKCRKVLFYCSAWSNLRSVRNAIKSGFVPAWIEMMVKPLEEVNAMNK
mgnify:FL=1